jgi:hypothetical protein
MAGQLFPLTLLYAAEMHRGVFLTLSVKPAANSPQRYFNHQYLSSMHTKKNGVVGKFSDRALQKELP